MRPNRTTEVAQREADDVPTEEIAVPQAPGRRRSPLTMISGVLAGSVVILAVGVVVAQVVSATRGQSGPGAVMVAAHVVGAVLAVLVQRVVDRSDGRPRLLAAWGVIAVFVVVLGVFWWGWLWLFWSF